MQERKAKLLNVQIKRDQEREIMMCLEEKVFSPSRTPLPNAPLLPFPLTDAETLLQGEGLVCLYRIGDICVAYPNCSYKKKEGGLSDTICFGS